MLNLAGLKYRNVMAVHGGPIARVEIGTLDLYGRTQVQANAFLAPGLIQKKSLGVYGSADGTGSHRSPLIARHMAVSEALERWAFHATVLSERREEFAFDVDPSSNGMAAFPGLFGGEARRRARLEAVERYCIIAWWSGELDGQQMETDWPGVRAVVIRGPMGGITVIVHKRTANGYSYGHAADESLGAAIEKAVVEMERHQRVIAFWSSLASGVRGRPANVFESQAVYFSSEEGFASFQERVGQPARGTPPPFEILCDKEIVGPWSKYATVWRVAFRPPSVEFLTSEKCFFS